jgi:hypothetical protein
MSDSPIKQNAVSIDAAQSQVLLRPENDDLFVRTGRQVIEACRLSISIELWVDEVKGMFEYISTWAQARDDIRACHASLGSRISLFFIPKTDSFNFDLADALVQLNAQLVSQFNVGLVEVRQIPFAEVDRFLDAALARTVYGEGLAAHPAVEA